MYYCLNDEEKKHQFRNDRIIFYLKEFIVSKGINIGLIHTVLTKIATDAAYFQQLLNECIIYCQEVIYEEEKNFNDTTDIENVLENQSDLSIKELMNITLQRDKTYLAKMKKNIHN